MIEYFKKHSVPLVMIYGGATILGLCIQGPQTALGLVGFCMMVNGVVYLIDKVI